MLGLELNTDIDARYAMTECNISTCSRTLWVALGGDEGESIVEREQIRIRGAFHT